MSSVASPPARRPPDEEAAEDARRLFAGPVAFLASAPDIAALPPPDLPEVAFAGRSNVGKSSLINALAGRRALARTSADPGRTRAVNLFSLGERGRMADLPGYGFARAPKSLARQFQGLARAYLAGRPSLRRVFLLIDSRLGVKASDEEAMAALDRAAVSYALVLTKADKLAPNDRPSALNRIAEAAKRHPAAFPDVVMTSSRTGLGVETLRMAVAAALAS